MEAQARHLWTVDDLPRRWSAHATQVGGTVIVRRYLVDPAVVEFDYPPTLELTWAEWLESHDDYGLNEDGTRVEVKA